MSRLNEGIPVSGKFRDSRVNAAFATHLYVAVRRRNAWHDTISQQYRGSGDKATVCTTLPEAKQASEEWRAMGSQFHIDEMTAIAFAVKDQCIIWADPWRTAPFSGWGQDSVRASIARENLRKGQRVADLLTAIDVGWPTPRTRPDTLLMVAERVDITPFDPNGAVSNRWISIAPGSSIAPLGWRKTELPYDNECAQRILDSFSAQSTDFAEPPRPLLAIEERLSTASAGRFSLLDAESGSICRVCAAWTPQPIEVRDGESTIHLCEQDLEAWMLRPSRAALERKIAELARLAALTRGRDDEVADKALWLERQHKKLRPELSRIECTECGQAYRSGVVWAKGWEPRKTSCDGCFPTRVTLTTLLLLAYGLSIRTGDSSPDSSLSPRAKENRESFLALGTTPD